MADDWADPLVYFESRRADIWDLQRALSILGYLSKPPTEEARRLIWGDFFGTFGFIHYVTLSNLVVQLPTFLGNKGTDKTSLLKLMDHLEKDADKELRDVIANCRRQIKKCSTAYSEVSGLRDQFFGHRDPKYLENPSGVWEENPKLWSNLKTLVDCAVAVFDGLASQFNAGNATPNFHDDIEGLFNRIVGAIQVEGRVQEAGNGLLLFGK
jgi:hypothetical protein